MGGGGLVFQMEGASFLSGRCVPLGASLLMGGGRFKESHRMGGASPSWPHPTMGKPLYEKFYADNG